jgi:tRNA(Ile2) C34 agmatinyltransferase TiaS
MTVQTSVEGNSAYRQGLCVDCQQRPHSAGRTRCTDCHAIHQQPPMRESV